MPGSATYTIRLYNIRFGSSGIIPTLKQVAPNALFTKNTYKDIKVIDDADFETYHQKNYAPRLNDNDYQHDTGTAQKFGELVRSTSGYPVYLNDIPGAGNQFPITVTTVDGRELTGTLYTLSVSAGGSWRSFGHVSTIPLKEGMKYKISGANAAVSFEDAPLYSAIAPCFVRGAMVQGLNGPVPIESLQAGDFVRTLDHGYQPLIWVGYSRIEEDTMRADPRKYPILVKAEAFGENTPARDCWYSRQHRILIPGISSHKSSDNESLVPAKDLLGLPGVELADGWSGSVDYFHLLFEHHEIVLSDGMLSESLLLTDYSKSLLGEEAKAEIALAANHLNEMKPAREIIEGKAARVAIEKSQLANT